MTLRQRTQALSRWLGGPGQPVDQATADRRAAICLNCPKHEVVAIEMATKPAATLLRRVMEVKGEMKLKVAREDELHTCGICLCWLPTKVWCGLDFARAVTPDWQKFPEHCWLRTEDTK
jgi:NAD-dependent dihydropyrimidine dehydrogenase PreA subunit